MVARGGRQRDDAGQGRQSSPDRRGPIPLAAEVTARRWVGAREPSRVGWHRDVLSFRARCPRPVKQWDPLSDQANPDREVELGPRPVGGEHLGGVASDSERKAAAVAQGQCPAPGRCHRRSDRRIARAPAAARRSVDRARRFGRGGRCRTGRCRDERGWDCPRPRHRASPGRSWGATPAVVDRRGRLACLRRRRRAGAPSCQRVRRLRDSVIIALDRQHRYRWTIRIRHRLCGPRAAQPLATAYRSSATPERNARDSSSSRRGIEVPLATKPFPRPWTAG